MLTRASVYRMIPFITAESAFGCRFAGGVEHAIGAVLYSCTFCTRPSSGGLLLCGLDSLVKP